MPLESLLLSRDAEVVRVLEPALEKLSIEVEVCRGVNSGHEILRTEKFDAIIVDCDDLDGGLRVLQGLRKGLSNKNSRPLIPPKKLMASSSSIPCGRSTIRMTS